MKRITVDWLGLVVWWIVGIVSGTLGLLIWLGELAWRRVTR